MKIEARLTPEERTEHLRKALCDRPGRRDVIATGAARKALGDRLRRGLAAKMADIERDRGMV